MYQRLLITSVVWAAVTCVAATTRAVDIYEDSFTRPAIGSAPLHDTSPDVTNTGGATWNADLWFTRGTTAQAPTGIEMWAGAWLPFTPAAGNIYTLSMDVVAHSAVSSNDWFVFGFTDSVITSAHFTSSGDPTFHSRKEVDFGATSTIFGVTDGKTVYNNIATGVTIPHSLEIILDTAPATWTAEFKVNGSGLAPIAFTAPNPTINHVGFHIRPQSTIEVDNFKLSAEPVVAGDLVWQKTGVGDWNEPANWAGSGAPPDTASETAVFGSAVTGPTSVATNTAVTVNRIEFDSSNPYAVGGLGSINLSAGTNDPFDPPSLSVSGGTAAAAHQFQAVVNLNDDTSAAIETGASLEFVNRLNLNGNTLTKTGSGTLLINNSFNTGSGTIVNAGGVIGGGGIVAGDLVMSDGILAPGNSNSPEILAIDGNSAVPEPASLLIASLGAIALTAARRGGLLFARA